MYNTFTALFNKFKRQIDKDESRLRFQKSLLYSYVWTGISNGSSTFNASSPVTSQSISATPSSTNNNSNAVTTPGSNGYGGGYGMMGGGMK